LRGVRHFKLQSSADVVLDELEKAMPPTIEV